MNRKDFFKRLFGAAAVAVVAPQVLGKEEDGTYFRVEDRGLSTFVDDNYDLYVNEHPLTPEECYNNYDIHGEISPLTPEQEIIKKKLLEKYKDMSFTEFLNIFNT